MHVHVIYTGGTIGMVDSPRGLVPGADLEGWLTRLLDRPRTPGASQGGPGPDDVTLTSLDPLIDSSNATPASWQQVIDTVRALAAPGTGSTPPGTGPTAPGTGPAAFVVLHGTDTLAYTAAAASYALTDLPHPVVLTGSQLPLGVLGSDAAGNVTGALVAATSGRVGGVSLFFGHRLLAGNRATKTSSWAYDGFDSPATPPLARVGAPWRWYPAPPAGTGWPVPRPYARQDVVVLDLVPGITARRLEALLTPLPDAVVLRAFGVGNAPGAEPGLTRVVKEAVEAGTAVVVASQCHEARVRLGHYETGEVLTRAGAVGAGDMTLEALYTKIVFLLSQGLRGAGLSDAVGRDIAGEVT